MLKSITLLFPRLKYRSGDPPLGICSIAGQLKKIYPNLEIHLLDTTFKNSFKSVITKIKKIKSQALGVYIDSVMYLQIKNLLKELRSYIPIIIAGGPHSTIYPESLLDVVDIVVRGEGEKTMEDLILALPKEDLDTIPGLYFKKNGKIYCTSDEPQRPNLNELEFPALDMLGNLENYIETWHYLDPINPQKRGLNVIASRGCCFNCSYCQPTLRYLFGKKIRYKNPEYLVGEISYYVKRFGVNNFFFHDDTLPVDKNWIENFCNLILENNLMINWGCNSRIDTVDEEILNLMYKAGLRVIHYGIESSSPRIVNQIYNKGIKINQIREIIHLTKKIGIQPSGFFMLGAPTETIIEMLRTISFSLGLELTEASFSITTPFYGTYLYQQVKADSRYKILESNVDYYSQVSLKRKGFPSFLISYLQKFAVITFYMSPKRWKYVFRHLLSFRGMKKLYNKMARFF